MQALAAHRHSSSFPRRQWLSSLSAPFKHLNTKRASSKGSAVKRAKDQPCIILWYNLSNRRSSNRHLDGVMPTGSDTLTKAIVSTPDRTCATSVAVQHHIDSPTEQAECQHSPVAPSRSPDLYDTTTTTTPDPDARSPSFSCQSGAEAATPPPDQGAEPISPTRALLNRRKKKLVDSLMEVVEQWLDNRLGPLQEPCDGEGGRSASSCAPPRQPAGRGGKKVSGQKRQLSQDDGNGSQEGDEEGNDEDRKKRPRMDATEAALKLACPYFKKDPTRFSAHRTCLGPGFGSISRLKEHLYRKHGLPRHQCKRCYDLFKEEKDLDAHVRSETPCPLRQDVPVIDPIEGFTAAQEAQLRVRKTHRGKSEKEAELWREIFCILFFEDPTSSDIPSPYYDHYPTSQPAGAAAAATSTSLPPQCAQFLRRELPSVIRREVEQELESKLHIVEDQLKAKAFDIIQTAVRKMIDTYAAIPPPPPSSSLPPQPSTAALAEAELAPLLAPPPPATVPQPEEAAAVVAVPQLAVEDFDLHEALSWIDEPLDIDNWFDQYQDASLLSSQGSSDGRSTVEDSLYFSHTSNTSVEFDRQGHRVELLPLGGDDDGAHVDVKQDRMHELADLTA